VLALTHETGDYTTYLLALRENPLALRVKLADMLHNVSSGGLKRSSWKKYTSAMDALKNESNESDGRPAGIALDHWHELNAALKANEPPNPEDVA